MGYGVFATQFIPKGTVTYIKDELEIEITPEAYQQYESDIRDVINKYSYIDDRGVRIISWDFAKYVNHSCDCNTMSTGYGFEIAIRDIQEGEEITDEYGMFNLDEEMQVFCGEPNCRKVLRRDDLLRHYQEWDEKVLPAILSYFEVSQPLGHLMDAATKEALKACQQDVRNYKSVLTLYHQPKENGVYAH